MAKVKFWEEAEGEQSATRLMFIVLLVYAMIMGAWVFAETKDYVGSLAMFSGIGTLAVGLKLYQKGQEAKPDEPIDPNKLDV